MKKITAHVYLIHLDKPLCHARHYLGYTALESVNDRLARHKRGDGAKMLRAANEQGIAYQIVRTWTCTTIQEAKELERRLKHQKNAGRLCPVCQGIAKKNSKTSKPRQGTPA